jgi:hypothetical protein
MLIVNGSESLIGSNIVTTLNDAGSADLAVCDQLGHEVKWRKLANRQPASPVHCAVRNRYTAQSHNADQTRLLLDDYICEQVVAHEISKPYGGVGPVDILQVSARRRCLPASAEA